MLGRRDLPYVPAGDPLPCRLRRTDTQAEIPAPPQVADGTAYSGRNGRRLYLEPG